MLVKKHRKDPLCGDYRHLKKVCLLGKSLAGNEAKCSEETLIIVTKSENTHKQKQVNSNKNKNTLSNMVD